MNELQAEQHVQQVIQSQPGIGRIISEEPIILDVLKLAASQSNHAEIARWYSPDQSNNQATQSAQGK